MNLFDIVIILFTFELVFKKFISERVFVISLVLSSITAFIQVIVVGYKWQYMPIYIIILSSAISHTFGFKFTNKFLKAVSFLILVILFISSTALIYFLPIPEFTIKNKVYSVGYDEILISVENRKQPKAFYELSNLNPDGNRELLVDIYYPSNDETSSIQLFKDSPSNWGETVVNYLNRTWGINIPSFLLSHLNLSYFDIGTDIEKLDDYFPIVIYTHGWAGEKIFATDQLITIASQGYVVIAIDHTGLSMFTELPTGTIFNTGSSEASSKVFDVMYEMSIDIENTLDYLDTNNIISNFSILNVIGHSTGGGSGHLFCLRNNCETLILQDPFFVPVVTELGAINVTTITYFIYSEDWYSGYEDSNELSEIEVYRKYLNNYNRAKGYYLTESAHYDFVAFGAVSPLTKYTFLKGSIDYKDSLKANNRFNLEALNNTDITTDDLIKEIEK